VGDDGLAQQDRRHGIQAGVLACDWVLGSTAGWASRQGCRSLGAGVLVHDQVLGLTTGWANRWG